MRTRTLGASALLPVGALAIVVLFGFQDARFAAASIAVALVELRAVSGVLAAGLVVAIAGLSLFAVPIVPGCSRRGVLGAIGLALAMRLLLQFLTAPLAGLAAAAAGLVMTVLVIGMAATIYGGRVTGTALLLGAGFDVAMMAGRRTLDLTRSSGAGALVVVVVLSVLAIASVWVERQSGSPRRYGGAVPAAGLFLVGPWFALHLLLTGNIGVIGTISGAPLTMAAVAGLVGAIGALAWAAPGRARSLPALAAVVVVVGLGLVVGADGGWALLLVSIVAMAAGATLTGSLERESMASPRRLGWSLAGGTAVGYLVVAAIEASIELPIGLSGDVWYAVIGFVLVGGAVIANTHRLEPSSAWVVPALTGVALLAVPLWLWAVDPDPAAIGGDPGEVMEEVIVATYNVDHGFNPDGVLDVAAIAAALDETAWQIAGLQEVSRGRLRDGGLDMVAWLEHELGSDLYWQASGSRFSGNALVTAFEVMLAEPLESAPADGVAESAIDASVTLPGVEEQIRVFVVGVQAPAPGILAALLERWRADVSTIVLGDFGERDPANDPLDSVVAAGFYDVAVLVDGTPATYPSDAPTEERDKVLISRDLMVSAVRIIDSTASDHLPVAVRVVVVADNE